MDKPPRSQGFYELLKYSSLGLEMGAAVVIGLLMGWWLDKKLSTAPWMTLLFLGFGFAAAVRALARAVREEAARNKEEER